MCRISTQVTDRALELLQSGKVGSALVVLDAGLSPDCPHYQEARHFRNRYVQCKFLSKTKPLVAREYLFEIKMEVRFLIGLLQRTVATIEDP